MDGRAPFLFGSRVKVEWNSSVSCLVEESYGYGHLFTSMVRLPSYLT
jgi:hypothetical protein